MTEGAVRAIYFDNAATSWPKPECVAREMSLFLAENAASPGRAAHRMAIAAEEAIDRVRRALADFVGGRDPNRLIFTSNATDGLNIAIKGLLREGDHVVTTMLEHNSVSRPLQAMADRGFITLTRVSFSRETGAIDPDDVRKAIEPRTKMIAMTHASNVIGTLQPIEEVGEIAHAHGAKLLVDASQTIGLVPIDVRRMHVDALAFPGHKSLLGPPGTGALYVNESVDPSEIQPFREGGTGGDSASPTQPAIFPHLLEGGTPNVVGIVGLGAALDFVKTNDPLLTLARARAALDRIIEALSSDSKFSVCGPKSTADRVGVLSFVVAGYSPQEVGAILDESFDIAVRPGLQCAPYAHRVLGTFPDGTVRISPGHFTTEEDVA
ncbi:MAG: aminotransferase class V-fold PLP-dependent enzyme [Polyangiaceae bacterium]